MRVRLTPLAPIALLALLAPISASAPGGWPGFRGPSGNGLSHEAGVPVGVLVAPVIPLITDQDLEHILEDEAYLFLKYRVRR